LNVLNYNFLQAKYDFCRKIAVQKYIIVLLKRRATILLKINDFYLKTSRILLAG